MTERDWWALLAAAPEDESVWDAYRWWLRDEADDPAGAAWVAWYRTPGEYERPGRPGRVGRRHPYQCDAGFWWWAKDAQKDSGLECANAVPTRVGRPAWGGSCFSSMYPTRAAAEQALLRDWRTAWAAGWRKQEGGVKSWTKA